MIKGIKQTRREHRDGNVAHPVTAPMIGRQHQHLPSVHAGLIEMRQAFRNVDEVACCRLVLLFAAMNGVVAFQHIKGLGAGRMDMQRRAHS